MRDSRKLSQTCSNIYGGRIKGVRSVSKCDQASLSYAIQQFFQSDSLGVKASGKRE